MERLANQRWRTTNEVEGAWFQVSHKFTSSVPNALLGVGACTYTCTGTHMYVHTCSFPVSHILMQCCSALKERHLPSLGSWPAGEQCRTETHQLSRPQTPSSSGSSAWWDLCTYGGLALFIYSIGCLVASAWDGIESGECEWLAWDVTAMSLLITLFKLLLSTSFSSKEYFTMSTVNVSANYRYVQGWHM